MRQELLDHLWDGAIPTQQPTIETGVSVPHSYQMVGEYATEHLSRVDTWTFSTGNGLASPVVYYYAPHTGITQMAIVHDGHCGYNCEGHREMIHALLVAGFGVLAVPMPSPSSAVHNEWAVNEVGDAGFIRIFFEAVAFAVGYAQSIGFERFAMMGVSGGGWTTHIYQALDERIGIGFAVAGSLPFGVQTAQDIAATDYEQKQARPLYGIATWEDIYALACSSGRRHVQMLNRRDSCCFSSDGRESTIQAYADAVNQQAGGRFSVWFDATHTSHRISTEARLFILRTLQEHGWIAPVSTSTTYSSGPYGRRGGRWIHSP